MIDNITLDNLHIGCKASNKAEVIAMIGAECKPKAMSIRSAFTFCWSVNIRFPLFWAMASPCRICRNQRRISFLKPGLRSISFLMALSGIAAT